MKKYKVCWTKEYDDRIVDYESDKTFDKNRAEYLTGVCEELTGKKHTIKLVEENNNE